MKTSSWLVAIAIVTSTLSGCASDSDADDDAFTEEDISTSSGAILGMLDDPGARLNRKSFKVTRGAALSFETSENQIQCIRALTVTPAAGAVLAETVIAPRPQNLLGGRTDYRRTLTVPTTAKPGAVVTVTSTPCFQARNDPKWSFTFKIVAK